MSSDSELKSLANLSSRSDKDIMEKDVEEISNTQTDVTRWCQVMFWPCDSYATFEGTLPQICALKFKNCVFQMLYFHIMWKKFFAS